MHAEVADLMLQIEVELRRLGVWAHEAPEPEKLASVEPFCIDTLTLPEWIQFVFIVKLKVIVEQGGVFPSTSGISPMVEEYARGQLMDFKPLIELMSQFDQLVSTPHCS